VIAGRRELREAEVEHLCVSAARDEDVGGLDVAVDDAFCVRCVERVGDFDSELDEQIKRERPAINLMLQSLAFEELHREKGPAIVLADLVDRANVRMVQRGGSAGFALKSFECLRIARGLFRQKLQRDVAAKSEILGFIYDAHPAAAELFEDAVMRDGLSDHSELNALGEEY
jgi:hypothetical protein